MKTVKQLRQVAIKSMLLEMKNISEQASRYLKEPDNWPGLKSKHERYVDLTDAIKLLEGEPCEWINHNDLWSTGCGGFFLPLNSLDEGKIAFCPYCGREVKVWE